MITVKEYIPDNPAEGEILDIVTCNSSYLTHGFHKYPAKFIPQIPRWAIARYLTGSRPGAVLDPFCGSGTTLVEALLAGRDGIGIDIDPLSTLITKVKTTPIEREALDTVCGWLARRMRRAPAGRFVPENANLKHWFCPDATDKLSAIRTAIDEAARRFANLPGIEDIYDFLIVCFSSIIRRVSNADNQSQKTYVSHTRPKVPEETLGVWESQLGYFRERITEFSARCPRETAKSSVFNASSTDIPERVGKARIALVVTSPPYIKSIDYIYNQMVELFWIGDLFGMQTQQLQNERKKNYVGNKHFLKKDYGGFDPTGNPVGIAPADAAIRRIYETDERNGEVHAYVTREYFARMELHFSAAARLLSPGTVYVMVVGDSRVSGIHIPTAATLTGIAGKYGFRLVRTWGYRIKNRYMRFDRKGRGGIIDTDWVVEMVRE